DEADEIDVLDGTMGRLQHERSELAVGRVQPGRVDEHHLGAGEILDPGDAIPRCLRPRRDDRELLADETIQQRRLSGVGPTDQRYESGADGHWTNARERSVGR